jgi:hypothetical protein
MAMASAGLGGVVRGLYLVAMAIFVLTVGIGILNGTDTVDFARNWILTHVHSGTLGWISLSIVATASWFFSTTDRRLAIALTILVPVYIAAFAWAEPVPRAIAGSLLLVAIAFVFVWAWRAYLASDRSVAALGIVLGITTFAYGAVIGVVLQIQAAAAQAWLTGDAIGAHAAAMAFGYLVLVAMGVVEWQLGVTGRRRLGQVQMGALFAGGLILSIGLLASAGQAAGGLYLLAELVAVVAFVIRVGPRVVRVAWGRVGAVRHVGAAAIWILGALFLLMYIIVLFIGAKGDVASIPQGALIAADHSVFIGVMTNVLLGLIGTVGRTAERRAAWIDQVVFFGVNLGLIVFVVGLIAGVAEIKRVGAPVMGVAILLGLAVRAMDLWADRDPALPAGAALTA